MRSMHLYVTADRQHARRCWVDNCVSHATCQQACDSLTTMPNNAADS